ncbi:MAG: ankyrin repeat domain-containing protein [Candidatus Delongbacteria bacterium]|nr:ankyrin repeat domain-containing protein [Candidatus Delongbacteria bacterium]
MYKIFRIIIIISVILSLFSCSSNEDKLFKAIEDGNLSKVISLVESGVSVITKDKNGLSPLEIARKNQFKEIELYLYEQLKKVFDSETDKLGLMVKKWVLKSL